MEYIGPNIHCPLKSLNHLHIKSNIFTSSNRVRVSVLPLDRSRIDWAPWGEVSLFYSWIYPTYTSLHVWLDKNMRIWIPKKLILILSSLILAFIYSFWVHLISSFMACYVDLIERFISFCRFYFCTSCFHVLSRKC